MPSHKARLMLTIEDPAHAALQRFAKLSGKPMATVVAELLNEVAPIFGQLADAAEAAAEKRSEALDMLLAPLAEAQIEAGQLSLNLARKRIKGAKRARKMAAAVAAATDRKGPELIGRKPRVKTP